MWALYWRPNPKKRRERFLVFAGYGEACANLCHALIVMPRGDWKLRKLLEAK